MKKILWKIESLWDEYIKEREVQNIDVTPHYEKRISKYYPRFQLVHDFDFSPSKNPVFTDDYGEYCGLKTAQVSLKSKKPVYLFDNHNEIIYPFVELSVATGTQYDVVHIDAHPDDAVFEGGKPSSLDISDLAEFIQQTRISDFFDALSETHIIGKVQRVCDSGSFESFELPQKPYILSLDIDIFGPEGDFTSLETKVSTIAEAWNSADAVCIAMSPGFIDQDFAQGIIRILV